MLSQVGLGWNTVGCLVMKRFVWEPLCGDYIQYTVLLRKKLTFSFVGTQATSVLKYYSPLCKNENRQ